MDQYLSEPTLKSIQRAQPFAELCFSVPSFLINLYFAFKFGSLTQYHPNLRILMITTNLFTSLISILHPVITGLPAHFYSIEKGHYFSALIVYTMAFTTHICALIIDVKYLLIGLERKYAFENRHIYESLNGSLARKFFFIVMPLSCVIMTIKIVGTFFVFRQKITNVDLLLASAFFLEQSPMTCSIMSSLGAVCVVYGLIVFFQLDKKAKSYKYAGKTLSESYEIKQVTTVVGILKPLIWAYTVMSTSCSFFLFSAFYLVFFGGHSTYSTLYLVLTNFAYITIAAYNFASTVYILLQFEPLKRALLRDIQFATGIQFKNNPEEVKFEIPNEKGPEANLEYLKNAWA